MSEVAVEIGGSGGEPTPEEIAAVLAAIYRSRQHSRPSSSGARWMRVARAEALGRWPLAARWATIERSL